MFSAVRRERSSSCISDMRFDAWFGGELNATEIEALGQHLSDCGHCRTRKLQILRERVRFDLENPALPEWLTSFDARRPTPKRRTTLLISGLCAAAAALFLALPQAPSIRTKGAAHLSFYVKRGENVHRGRLRERLIAGDKLRFAYTALRPHYLAILSLDGAGHASAYYPAGTHAAWIDAGADVLLPSAVELDESVGEERIIGLFCDGAVQVAPLLAALEAKQIDLQKPDGCTLDELVVVKQAHTP